MRVRLLGFAMTVVAMFLVAVPAGGSPLFKAAPDTLHTGATSAGTTWIPVVLSGQVMLIPIPSPLLPGSPGPLPRKGGSVDDTPVWGRSASLR